MDDDSALDTAQSIHASGSSLESRIRSFPRHPPYLFALNERQNCREARSRLERDACPDSVYNCDNVPGGRRPRSKRERRLIATAGNKLVDRRGLSRWTESGLARRYGCPSRALKTWVPRRSTARRWKMKAARSRQRFQPGSRDRWTEARRFHGRRVWKPCSTIDQLFNELVSSGDGKLRETEPSRQWLGLNRNRRIGGSSR